MSDPSTPTNKIAETPYDVWSAENVYTDEVESLTKYFDNLRDEYLAGGQYTEAVERGLQLNLQKSLVARDLLTEENAEEVSNKINALRRPSLLQEAQFIKTQSAQGFRDVMDFEEGELELITEYVVAKDRAASGQVGGIASKEYDEKKLGEILRQKRENYVKSLYENNQISAGVYYDKEGNRKFLGGRIPEGQTEYDVIKKHSSEGVMASDVFALRSKRERIADRNNKMRYEIEQREDAKKAIQVFLDPQDTLQDQDIKARFEALATDLGRTNSWGFVDRAYHNTGDWINDKGRSIRQFWNWITFDSDEQNEVYQQRMYEKDRLKYEEDVEETKDELLATLTEKTGLSGEILEDAVDDIIATQAFYGTYDTEATFKFTDEEDELEKNVFKSKFSGVFVQDDLNFKPELYDKALKKAGLSDEEIEIQNSQRVAVNEARFNDYSEVLSVDGQYGDKWNEALIDGKLNGLSNNEIMEGFVAEYNPSLRARGYGISAVQSISTLWYAIPAFLGNEGAQDALVRNQETLAHLNQMRKIFGMEASTLQMMGEQAAPLIVDGLITLGGLALSPVTGGGSALAAGGYFTAKAGVSTTARTLVKATFTNTLKRRTFKNAAGEIVTESAEDATTRVLLAGTLGKNVKGKQILKAINVYNSKLGKTLNIGAAQFASAAARSGSHTYGAVFKTIQDDYTAKYKDAAGEWVEGWSEERVRQEAHKAAFGSALTAGTVTGIITAGMGMIGGGKFGGLENAYLQGVSFSQMKKITDRIVGSMTSKEGYLKLMQDVTKESLIKAGGSKLMRYGGSIVGEGFEEGLDEFVNSIIQDAWTNKETSFRERIEGAFQAALLGAALGGTAPLVGAGLKKLSKKTFVDQDAMLKLEGSIMKEFEARVDASKDLSMDDLRATAPETAKMVDQINERYGQGGGSGSGAKVDDDDSGEQEAADKAADDEQASDEAEDIDEKFKENNTEGAVDKAVKDAQDDTKKKSTADPKVVTSPVVNDALSGESNPTDGQVAISSSHPTLSKDLTPEQKYQHISNEINAKEAEYKKQELALQSLPPELFEERKAKLDAAVRAGKLLDANAAASQRKKAQQKLKEEQKEAANPVKISEADIKALENLIDQGYPVHFIEEHLEQLGLELDRTDGRYLRELTNELRTRVREIYPTIKVKMPTGGAKLPKTLDPEGNVFIDQDGVGVFNNDPAGMLTLLQNNVLIPLTEDQYNNPQLNQSFVTEKVGDSYYVTDIMVPVKGGLVSAKTAFNKVAVHETDYSAIKNIVRRVTDLKLTVDIPKGLKVETPFSKSDRGGRRGKVALGTLLKEAKDINKLKAIIAKATGFSLTKDYVEAAAVTMSLDLQEQIYKYASAVSNGESVGSQVVDLEKTRNKHASYYTKMQTDRKSKARRDFASILSPDSKVHKDPNIYDADKNAEDHFVPPNLSPIDPIPETKLSKFVEGRIEDVATALAMDERLMREAKRILNKEVYKGKKVAKNFSAEKTATELVIFFAANGGGAANPRLGRFESEMENFKLGRELKEALTILGVTNPAAQKSLETDPALYTLIESQLQALVGEDVALLPSDVSAFYTQVRKASALYKKRAVKDIRDRREIARDNLQQIDGLGLEDGNPESVIEALEKIAKEGPKPLRVIAKALLKRKDLIRSVQFEIVQSPIEAAGYYYVDQNGTRRIVINIDRSGDRGVADTLVHEYIHAVTDDILRTPVESRTPAENEAIANIERLLNIAKKKASETGKPNLIYGTENIDEFITHVLTDPEFQAFLNGITSKTKGSSNLLVRLFYSIANLVGFKTKEFRTAVQQALDLTQRHGIPSPETKSGYANQVARSVHRSQAEVSDLAEAIGMGDEASLAKVLQQRAAEVVTFVSSYLPRELNLQIDNESSVVAKVDADTGAIILNPERAAIKLAQMGESTRLDPQRRQHILGAIINEEIGHAAARAMLTDGQIVEITNSMTDEQFEAVIKDYYPLDQQEAALERLRSDDPQESSVEKYKMTEEALVLHASRAMRGMTTNESVAFLSTNPALIPTFIQYMKALLSKLTYHVNNRDVSPEMRKAVNNVIIEIRALELNYRPAPSTMTHNPRNPYAVVETLMEQAVSSQRLVPKSDQNRVVYYHGTSTEGGKNIREKGVDQSKSAKGYFGRGFYAAFDRKLAQDNYADFAEEESEGGDVIAFSLPWTAKVLDLREAEDFNTWKNLKYRGRPVGDLVGEDNFNEIMTELGIDGLIDNSFEGIVIYNENLIDIVDPLDVESTFGADVSQELLDIGKRDDIRVGTSKIGTKAVPKETPRESNIGGVAGEGNPDTKAADRLKRITIPNQIKQITATLKSKSPNGRYILPDEFKRARNPEKKLQILKDYLADNLIALHDAVDPQIRERSKRWYQGANRIANGLAAKYDLNPEQVAGVMASLSPQKDWFLNLAQAEQTIEVYRHYQDYVMDTEKFDEVVEDTIAVAEAPQARKKGKSKAVKDALDAEAREIRRNLLAQIKGKTIAELKGGDPKLVGWAVRLIAEAEFGKGVTNVTPEGEPNGPYLKPNGEPVANGWGSAGETAKAFSILEDGSPENISTQLGKFHKVRSFFNNIASPYSEYGDVTIDTHAVAAAFLMPYAQKAVPVAHNFGTSSASSDRDGMQGTYHIYADAYRQAAATLGIPPYQLQSITWEAIREIYPADSRKNLKYVAERENIHNENDPEQARNRILGRDIPKPLWFGTPDSGVLDRAEALIGDDSQKEAISRRGLLFSGRRTPDGGGVTDLGVPELQPTTFRAKPSADLDLDLESQFGVDSKLPEFIDEVGMQEEKIGNWLELLDVPLMEFSDYDISLESDEDINLRGKIKRTLVKTFKRRADRRVVEFYNQNKAFIRETRGVVADYQKKFNRIFEEENARLAQITGKEDNIPMELIANASGSNMGTQLTVEQENTVDGAYLSALDKAKRLMGDDKKAAEEKAKEKKEQMTLDFREKNRKEQIAKRDKALEDLLLLSPKLATEIIVEMRKLQDQLSKKAMEVFKGTMDESDLKLAFDFNRGIYITRRYRMFEDNNFLKDVKESDEYSGVRERAVVYFAKQLALKKVDSLMEKEGLSRADARQKLEEEAVAKDSSYRSEATVMMQEFIDSYGQAKVRKKIEVRQGAGGEQILLPDVKFKSESLNELVDKLNEKKNIPEPIRELLGEYGDEAGLENLAYTLVHTASRVSNQSFFNKMKELGTKSDNPWMVTEEEYQKGKNDKYVNWTQIKTDQGDYDLTPIKGMYVPDQVHSNLEDLFGQKGNDDYIDERNERVQIESGIKRFLKKATGYSLAMKTLGSVGFYLRNMIGNGLFFGPMQGYYGGARRVGGELLGMGKATVSAARGDGFDTEYDPKTGKGSLMVKAARGSLEQLNFELVELKSMDIFGDELEISAISDLLTEKNKFSDMEKELTVLGRANEWLMNTVKKGGSAIVPDEYIPALKKAGVKVGEGGKMTVAALKKAPDALISHGGRLASAADGFFKIGLYEFELSHLIEAAKYEQENGKPNGEYARLLKEDGTPSTGMKMMAASIVKDTSQSYSRAVPFIKTWSSSSYGLAFAPYVRFAADVPRVYLGGLGRIIKEKKSDNPVIQRRGNKRARGYIFTSAATLAATKGVQAIFGAGGEDEDKALKAMAPEWMKNTSAVIYKYGGQWFSVDLTYLNPFAIIQDPMVMGAQDILRGDFKKAFNLSPIDQTGILGGFLKPYMNEQILAGAIFNAVMNDDEYGNKIVFDEDTKKALTVGKYIFDRAFAPRTLMAGEKSLDALLSGRDAKTFFDSPFGHLVKEIMPVRPHPMDLDKGFRRFVKSHMEDYSANSKRMYKLNSDNITTGEIKDLYLNFARNRIKQNNDFGQIMRGFEGLGLSRAQMEKDARSLGVSKERLRQNRLGFMNRPIITKPLEAILKQTRNGRMTLRTLKETYEKEYPKPQIKIDP
jgi:hypothetical protein|tara:strand:- start:754 stop:12540 length:11787 start_codon:yes stop_codon:yes gene_type:complete